MTSEDFLVLWMTYEAGPKAELDLAELILLSRFLVKLAERFSLRRSAEFVAHGVWFASCVQFAKLHIFCRTAWQVLSYSFKIREHISRCVGSGLPTTRTSRSLGGSVLWTWTRGQPRAKTMVDVPTPNTSQAQPAWLSTQNVLE